MNLTESFGDWQGRELWRIPVERVLKVQGPLGPNLSGQRTEQIYRSKDMSKAIFRSS